MSNSRTHVASPQAARSPGAAPAGASPAHAPEARGPAPIPQHGRLLLDVPAHRPPPRERRLGGTVHADMVAPDGPGQPLAAAVRTKMEAAFGADFSAIRVHEDGKASALGTHAFAMGDRLHFGEGKYRPESGDGQRLIGHELTHVVQQRAGRARGGSGAVAINRDRALEHEADVQGAAAAGGRAVTVRGHASGVQGKAIVGGGGVVQCEAEVSEKNILHGQREVIEPNRLANPPHSFTTNLGNTYFNPGSAETAQVQMQFSGNSLTDINKAVQQTGQGAAGSGQTWHHMHGVSSGGSGTMILVDTASHAANPHHGGTAQAKALKWEDPDKIAKYGLYSKWKENQDG